MGNNLEWPYVLLSVVGSGGFAVVHHAKCKSSGQEIAIKMVTR